MPLKTEFQSKLPLRFDENGRFRILIISDMHHAPDTGLKVIDDIERLIRFSKPDFVLMGGDNTTGKSEKSQFELLLSQIAAPMETRGIPWAHVFGNHDISKGLSKAYQQSVYETYQYCVSKAGPRKLTGVGNWFLPVMNAHDEVRFGIWGLDSLQDFKTQDRPVPGLDNPYWELLMPANINGGSDSDFVHLDQIEWYIKSSRAVEKQCGHKVPSIMMLHIPLPEFNAIVRNPGRTGFTGEYNEKVSCSELNSGLFAALLQRGDVKAVFAGHDHINTFEGTYCGIRLGYAGSVGDHGYGARAFDPANDRERLRGGRICDVFDCNTIKINTNMVMLNEIPY